MSFSGESDIWESWGDVWMSDSPESDIWTAGRCATWIMVVALVRIMPPLTTSPRMPRDAVHTPGSPTRGCTLPL